MMSCSHHLLCIVLRKMLFTYGHGNHSAITVSVLCFAAISRASLSSEIKYTAPHDVTIKDQQKLIS